MGRACYAWNEGCSCHQGTPPEKERCPDSKDNLQQFLQHKARERIETNIRWKRRKYTHNGGFSRWSYGARAQRGRTATSQKKNRQATALVDVAPSIISTPVLPSRPHFDGLT